MILSIVCLFAGGSLPFTFIHDAMVIAVRYIPLDCSRTTRSFNGFVWIVHFKMVLSSLQSIFFMVYSFVSVWGYMEDVNPKSIGKTL